MILKLRKHLQGEHFVADLVIKTLMVSTAVLFVADIICIALS